MLFFNYYFPIHLQVFLITLEEHCILSFRAVGEIVGSSILPRGISLSVMHESFSNNGGAVLFPLASTMGTRRGIQLTVSV